MLRKYKSVVFWFLFVSSWIIGYYPCCNEEDCFPRIETQQCFDDFRSYIIESMCDQKKWTYFKITITPDDKNTKISLSSTREIVSEEYIHDANKGNNKGSVNNIYTWQNNIDENENVILKKFNNYNLNAFIVGYSDVNFTVGNIINAGNKEEGNKTYYYVLVNDITPKKDGLDKYVPLFRVLEEKACGKNFTYSIEIIDANTTEVTNMRSMFNECTKLTEIKGLDKWNTNNVTDMNNMFYFCTSLKSLPDISNWDTSNVTDMCYMFSGCNKLKSLPNIAEWNTSNVTNMSGMFYGCEELEKLPGISTWDTNNVTDMSWMFSSCNLLASLPDISKWHTKNVINMSNMFNGCKNLIEIKGLKNWKTYNVTDMSGMFKGCSSLKSLPGISNWDTGNVTHMVSMFDGCEKLEKLPDISNWNTNSVTDMNWMFNGCKELTIKTSKLDNIKKILLQTYSNCSITLYVSGLDLTGFRKSMKDMFKGCKALTKIVFGENWNTEDVTDMSYMFNNCENLIKIEGLDNWKTSNVTDMSDMFSGCEKLIEIEGIDKWKTNNVTDMKRMFSACKALKQLPDISGWNTNNVKNMNSMFYNCKELKKLPDISKWDTKNVIDMDYMFYGCSSLKEINFKEWQNFTMCTAILEGCKEITIKTSKWDDNIKKIFSKDYGEDSSITLNVSGLDLGKIGTSMNGMFFGCKALTKIEGLENWKTSNVKDMKGMFDGCEDLTIKPREWNEDIKEILSQVYENSSITLDVSDLDLANFKGSMKEMFYRCKAITKIVGLNKWDTSKITDMSDMFNRCEKLIEIVGIENWNTSNVTDMSCMFCGCSSLKSLPANIANWDTKNVTSMNSMFYGCYNLESLPGISKWNISNVTDMYNMFYRCDKIKNKIPDKFK